MAVPQGSGFHSFDTMITRFLFLMALWAGLAGGAVAASLMEPAGVPDRFIGASNAPSTLIVYTSPTCVHCIRFEQELLPQIKSRYVDSGRLRIAMRPILNSALDATILLLADARGSEHRDAMLAHFRARHARLMAAKDMQLALFQVAAEAGVDPADFTRAMQNQARLQAVQRLTRQAYEEFGIRGTPTLLLDGAKLEFDGSISSLARILDHAYRSKSPRP